MELTGKTRIGEVVKENFKTAQIFDKNNIDFCCGGGISIEEACNKTGANLDGLLSELEMVVYSNDPDSRYINSLELDELCDYIEKRHHTYVKENIPFLQQKLEKLCNVHGENHPELFEVREQFDGAAQNLGNHLNNEEQELFPYIRLMVKAKKGRSVSLTDIGKAQSMIGGMTEEHQIEGDRFATIASLTSNYTCPPDGCNTFRVTYQTLNDFEQDLHKHVHLENNILFLKALELEKQLMK